VNILLSIACITYKHENFIDKSIEGFLSQKTNFNFEIIICDDASPDKTEEIVNKYSNKKYCNIIFKYFRHSSNIGPYQNGLFCLKQCTGNYIAFCEGDDYWTDPNKLQKQIDFLEQNQDFNICYHDVLILNKNGSLEKDFINKTQKKISTKFDLAVWGNYIHTCSVVVRNNKFFVNLSFEKNFCDYILYMYFLGDGKIKKIEESMSVYRYGNGIWSKSSNSIKYKFMIDNLYYVLNNWEDDTIKEVMKLRMNSYFFYCLPNYLSKIEVSENRQVYFRINEKVPIKILLSLIFQKIKLKYKQVFF
jgi:glycosyltransferase involved in cell wall biosynthesis